MLRRILHSQVGHFLEHERFYPGDGKALTIFHGDPSSHDNNKALESALGINIPEDHLLDYYIQAFPDSADDFCVVMVSAPFPLFTDGTSQVIGLLDKEGRLVISSNLRLSEEKKIASNKEI